MSAVFNLSVETGGGGEILVLAIGLKELYKLDLSLTGYKVIFPSHNRECSYLKVNKLFHEHFKPTFCLPV